MRRAGVLEVTLVLVVAQLGLFLTANLAIAEFLSLYELSGTVVPDKSTIPQPYELYGVARDSAGVVLPDGSPIRTFVDGAEYSNSTSVFSRPGMNDGYFQVETYGNFRTDRMTSETPMIREGAEENDSIMYTWGDMSDLTGKGVVFKETHGWKTGLPPQAGDLNAAAPVVQPPLIKIYSIVTNSTLGIGNDYVWLCNPTASTVDASQFYIEKDVPGSFNGPTVPVTGTMAAGGTLFVDLQSTSYFVELGDNVKLVWNNTAGPVAAFRGNDIVVDRVEFNASIGGTLFWEPGNTIQNDEVAPARGMQMNRTSSCRDTNSDQRDFYIEVEIVPTPPMPPWPLSLDGLSSSTMSSAWTHVMNLSGFTIGWRHDPFGYPQTSAEPAISLGPNRVSVLWQTSVMGTSELAAYTGPPLQACTDYWLSVRTKDLQWSGLADWKFHTNCLPSMVGLLSPANGATDLNPGARRVYWSASVDVDPGDSVNYTWQVAIDPGVSSIVAQGVTADNYSSLFPANQNTTYFWRVNVSDGWQSNIYSGPWSFSTRAYNGPILLGFQSPLGGENWTGGTKHLATYSITDDIDLQLYTMVNYSLDGGLSGYPYVVFSGYKPVGFVSIPWTLPFANSTSARIQVTSIDSDGMLTIGWSELFSIDSTPPIILSISPDDGSSDVNVTDPIQVLFSDTVNHPSAESAFWISPDPGGIAFTWSTPSPSTEMLTISHAPFKTRTHYLVAFSTTLRDVSDPGNHLETSFTSEFTTVFPPPVTPPVANATARSVAAVGEKVMFDGSISTGNITSFVWTIVDDQSRIVSVLSGEFVNYTFMVRGTYSITLTVVDGSTGMSSQDTLEIVITYVPPVARARCRSQAVVGETVMFDGSNSTGNISSYDWTIVDSQGRIVAILSGKFVNHTFNDPGRYAITLTVTDGLTGVSSHDALEIVVSAKMDFDWLVVLLVLSAAGVSGGLIGGTEIGRVALLMLLVAPVYKRKVKGEEDPETRGLILGYIIGNPGDNYTDIKRNLRLNNGPLSWHLMKLLKSGQIKSRIDGSKRRYYPANVPLPVGDGGELHEIQRRLMRAVREDSGKPVKILAEELGISSQLALYHLRKLSQRRLLVLERRGFQLKVYPRERPKT